MAIKFKYELRDMPAWAAKTVMTAKDSQHAGLLVERMASNLMRLKRWANQNRKPAEPSWACQHPLMVVYSVRIASLVLDAPDLLQDERYVEAVLMAETVLSVRA